MHKERLLAIVEAILSQPTAPFHEAAVRETIAARLRIALGWSCARTISAT